MNSERFLPLESLSAKAIIPVVKLTEKKTYHPWRHSHIPAITVKVGDVISKSGKKEKRVLEEIEKAGGIHQHKDFQDFKGSIILSPITDDGRIFYLTKKRYAKIINILKPDYYISCDAPTYHGYPNLSEHWMRIIFKRTKFLMRTCHQSQPVGLVKGCNLKQIRWYTNKLLHLGIRVFVFHAGDFLSKASRYELYEAKDFAKTIRRMIPPHAKLLVYGLGAQQNLIHFYVADGFITHSHFAYKMDTHEKVMKRLKGIENNLIDLQCQSRLNWWAEKEKIVVIERAVQN